MGSIALFRDGECVLEEREEAQGLRSSGAQNGAVPDALARLRLSPSDITHCAIGLGPGSFAGIRSALAFLQGFAAPRRLPILGISSAAATAKVAQAFLSAHDAKGDLTILGDARRGHYWVYAQGEMRLVPYAEFTLGTAGNAFSPEAERLCLAGVRPAIPMARAVGELALDPSIPKLSPPLPIYLHPAV